MGVSQTVKRVCDIVVSGSIILMLLPVYMIVSVLIKLSGEDVLFLQERVGHRLQHFRLMKFTTMPKGSEKLGDLTTAADPRPTPLGRILRKTKINELPQLFNVFLGDMSIVGPRPLMPVHAAFYPLNQRREIYCAKPGLTGIGSILFRDEPSLLAECGSDTREFYSREIAPYKAKVEMWYAEKRSLCLDLFLFLATVWVVLFPKSRLHMSLLGGLPRPESAVLARCMGLRQAGEEVAGVGDMPVVEQEVG